MAALIAAGIGAAGAVAGGSASKKGAKSAADTQAQAASHAADLSYAQYQQTRSDLAPFRSIGVNATDLLAQVLGLPSSATTPRAAAPSVGASLPTTTAGAVPGGILLPNGLSFIPKGPVSGSDVLAERGVVVDPNGNRVATLPDSISTQDQAAAWLQSNGFLSPQGGAGGGGAPPAPPMSTEDAMKAALGRYGLKSLTFQPTQAELAATPGYQFDLAQGLLGVAGSNAAKGKGISGDALKGAAAFATGLANNTLTTQQGIFQQNLANVINPLEWAANLGQTAATQTGQLGLQGVNAVNAANIGGANALAAGQVGSANAIANAFGGIGNAATNYLLFNNLTNGGGGGGYVDSGGFAL